MTLLNQRYEIQGELGHGGMGVVYRGIDAQTQQIVAIKKLKIDDFSDVSALLARFQREGEALRRLNHPNIVKMLDTFAENGDHYLVMELVEGGSLAEQSTEPLAIDTLLPLSLDIADALTRAHRLNIIHRDLKPANVLIAADGTPRLSDFGVAYVSKQEGANITTTGAIVGTPHYLAPEMLKGVEPSPSSDIWALGVLLFELLARRKPFDGNHLSATFAAILYEPTPDLEALRPDAPLALVDLIYRMLDKDPQTRISSVRIVGAELEALLQGKAIPKPSAPLTEATIFIESRFVTPTPSSNAPKHNLPSNLTPFVGRETELAEVARLLHDPQNRLITILASGGMGKTRLSIEVATRELTNFANGVYLVELAPLSTVDSIPTALALALNFQFYEGKPQDQQIIDYLREKQVLLVMDNFEHLLDGTVYVSEILKHAPQVKIIATSRESLNLQEETRFRLSGLDFPDWETPTDALEYSAVKLFIQSARRVLPNFELTRDDLNYLARICRLVQGMPLGIVLAAAWVEMLSLQEIADEIGTSLDFLETDSRNVPDRHRSIRAVFETSWERLTEEQQLALAKLSVFRGGFTREAAQQVAGASLKILTALVNKSLLFRDANSGRYDMHELLRQYAALELERMDLVEKTEFAYMEIYCQFLAGYKDAIRGLQQRTAFAAIEADYQNYYSAWEIALRQANFELLGASLFTFQYFCDYSGHRLDIHQMIEKAHRLPRENLELPALIIWARIQIYYAYYRIRDFKEREVFLQEILAVLESCDAEQETAVIYELLGMIQDYYHHFAEAEKLFQKTIEINTRYDKQWAISVGLTNLAWLYGVRMGEIDKGIAYGTKVLNIKHEMRDYIGLKAINGILATIYLQIKDFEQAYLYLEQGLAAARTVGDKAGIAYTLKYIGQCMILLKNLDKARQSLLESIVIYRDLGQQAYMVLAILGYAEYIDGNFDKAKACLIETLENTTPERFAKDMEYFAFIVITVAFLFAQAGRAERTLELLSNAFADPSYRHIRWQFDGMEKQLYEKLKTELSSDAFTQVETRGLALDKIQLHADLLQELRINR